MTEADAIAWLRAERVALVRSIAASFHGAPTVDVLDYLYTVETAAPSREESGRLWGEIQSEAARLALAERGAAEAS